MFTFLYVSPTESKKTRFPPSVEDKHERSAFCICAPRRVQVIRIMTKPCKPRAAAASLVKWHHLAATFVKFASEKPEGLFVRLRNDTLSSLRSCEFQAAEINKNWSLSAGSVALEGGGALTALRRMTLVYTVSSKLLGLNPLHLLKEK